MNYPNVSVIIPAKDEEQNIGMTLDALQKVDYPKSKMEIILIDNGSVDATIDIAKKYNVKIIKESGSNISGLRNLSTKNAKGEIFAFIDADILVTKDWLSIGINKMIESGSICLGGYIDIPSESSWVERIWHMRLEEKPKEKYVEWVSSMNMFVKKEAFFKIGGFNEKLNTCEDVDLCFRLSKLGEILYAKEVKVIHLGEAKNIRHFFLKERWRGQSNFLGVLSHGFHRSEIISLILPLYYLYFYLTIIPFLVFGGSTLIILFFQLLLFFAIPLTRSLLICLRLRRILCFFPLTFLWWLYYTARAASLFYFGNSRK